MRVFSRSSGFAALQQSHSVNGAGISLKRKKSKRRPESARTGKGGVSTYDACDSFFKQARNMLLYKRDVDSVTSSSTVKRENIDRARERLANCAVGCVCYDLAEQNYDEHSIGYRHSGSTHGKGSYVVPEKLMRMVLASFAHMLSEQQRRNVLGMMGNVLLGKYARAYCTHEFVKLLRVVHDLELQLYPHRSDSPFADVVVTVVGLLKKAVAEEGAVEIPNTRVDVMILSLEAGLLLRAAMQACDVLGEEAGLSEYERGRCTELKKKVLRSEGWFRSVYAGVHMVAAKSESEVIAGCGANKLQMIGTYRDIVGNEKNSSTEEYVQAVIGMGSILDQVNKIGRECEELLGKLRGNSGVASSSTTGSVDSDVDRVSSGSSSGSTVSMGLRLREFSSHMVCDVKKVLCGEQDEHFLLDNWIGGESVENTDTCSGKLFASIVASCAMKYLDTLCERESERVPGDIEIRCVRQAQEIFGQCASVGKNEWSCVSDKMGTGFALMMGIVVANVSSGDVFRATGANVVMNYRMLALFTSMVCSLNPTEMKRCLDKLRNAFEAYGSAIPEGVDDMIGMLVDIKRAAWWEDCGVYATSHIDGCRIEMIDTLTKLMGYKHFCDQKEGSGAGVLVGETRLLSDVDWLQVSALLLYESATMANTALRMQCAANENDAKKLSENAFNVCGRMFELNKTRKRLVAAYCDTSSLERDEEKVNKDIRDYKEAVGLKLRRVVCKYRIDGGGECADETVQEVWAHRSEMWNKSKAELMSGKDLDNTLIGYMLSIAHMSAKFALDIFTSDQWKCRQYDMPTLSRIVDVHFRCDKTLSHKAAAANDVAIKGLPSRIDGGGS